MVDLVSGSGTVLDDITPEERARLLRYCARVTSNLDSAEDLVQQTLLEAWKHGSRVPGPEQRMAWLFGVARNVCLRWRRTQGRTAAREVALGGVDDEWAVPGTAAPVDPGDPLGEIERSDLAR